MRASNWQNDGSGFEDRVKTVLVQYSSRGRMRCLKVDPPTKTLGPGQIIHLANPYLDFVGTWTARNGRAIFFEVKSTAKPRLDFGGGGLTDNQIRALEAWSNAGAVAFVLWEHKEAVRLVTAAEVMLVRAKGKRSLAWEDAGTPVLQGKGFIYFDFAAVMDEIWTRAPVCP